MKAFKKPRTKKPKEDKVNEILEPKSAKRFTEAEIESRYQAHLVKIRGGK